MGRFHETHCYYHWYSDTNSSIKKLKIDHCVFQYLPIVPCTVFHQTKCMGHYQQVIDEVRALGLGAATPMATIEAEATKTMVCWKR
jgi:hypothetical protein